MTIVSEKTLQRQYDVIPALAKRSLGCIVIGGFGQLGQSIVRSLYRENAAVGFTYFRNDAVATELCDALPGVIFSQANGRDLVALDSAIKVLANQLPSVGSIIHCASVCLTPGKEWESTHYAKSNGDDECQFPRESNRHRGAMLFCFTEPLRGSNCATLISP